MCKSRPVKALEAGQRLACFLGLSLILDKYV